jgi:hypothetical protein
LKENEAPWIVCPRRLFHIGDSWDVGTKIAKFILKLANIPVGTTIGAWSEVKIKYDQLTKNGQKTFDYTFDYLIMPLIKVTVEEAKLQSGLSQRELEKLFKKNGLSYDLFPSGPPIIVEIMTSSTSGGNKKDRSTIANAFEDAVLGKDHSAPGINYRQVWARMVSQLIVKSEVAHAWGGTTFWLLQDALINYISKSTALNLENFKSTTINEVNIVGLSYGKNYSNLTGLINLDDIDLYSGPITSSRETLPSFSDMIRTPVKPPKEVLVSLILRKSLDGTMTIK